MSKTVQVYVDDLNDAIIEQWSEMVSNINRNLANRYSKEDERTASEIFSRLESLYFNNVELTVDNYQFLSLEEGDEDNI